MTANVHDSDNTNNTNTEVILSARIRDYQKSLMLDRIPKPRVTRGEQVLLKVGAAGLCHSDLNLINGEWKDLILVQLPMTPGHEVAGWIEEIGDSVPQRFLNKGDLVAVFGGWGCGNLYPLQGW